MHIWYRNTTSEIHNNLIAILKQNASCNVALLELRHGDFIEMNDTNEKHIPVE